MDRLAEAVQDEVGPTGVLAWAMRVADGIAATERADDQD